MAKFSLNIENAMCRCREITKNISINSNKDMRSILDGALRYSNRLSGELVEYKESDLKRIMVNYIRHSESSYDNGLKSIHRACRHTDYDINELNYSMYKNATLTQIAQSYPYLQDECENQKRKVDMIKICY